MPRWLPLEANPEVMNGFIHSLGVGENVNLVDVLGVDEELLNMVEGPTLSLLLLFPTNEKYEAYCAQKELELKGAGDSFPEGVFFIKQTIENACGTIALIHSIYNNRANITFDKGSELQSFYEKIKDLSPEERGKALEANETIASKHSEHALLGQTAAPDIEEPIPLHFVSFVNVNNQLYEMDGRKSVPICYGSTSAETFLKDAAKACKEYMERDPNEVRFSLVALTAQ